MGCAPQKKQIQYRQDILPYHSEVCVELVGMVSYNSKLLLSPSTIVCTELILDCPRSCFRSASLLRLIPETHLGRCKALKHHVLLQCPSYPDASMLCCQYFVGQVLLPAPTPYETQLFLQIGKLPGYVCSHLLLHTH